MCAPDPLLEGVAKSTSLLQDVVRLEIQSLLVVLCQIWGPLIRPGRLEVVKLETTVDVYRCQKRNEVDIYAAKAAQGDCCKPMERKAFIHVTQMSQVLLDLREVEHASRSKVMQERAVEDPDL